MERARIGHTDKKQAIQKLSMISSMLEKDFTPNDRHFDDIIAEERHNSWKYGGRTIFGTAKPTQEQQLKLF